MTKVLKHKRVTLARIEKYISDTYFTNVNLYGRVDKKVDGGFELYQSTALKTDKFIDAKAASWTITDSNIIFRPLWSQHWIKVVIKGEVALHKNLYLHWNVDGAETLVYDERGNCVQGMSCKRKEMKIAALSQNADIVYFVQVSCTGLFGAGKNGMINPPDENKTYSLSNVHLFERDDLKYRVYMDLKVIYDIAKESPDNSTLCYDAMYTGNDMINLLSELDHSPEAYERAHKLAEQKIFKSGSDSADTVHVIGNCHIDCAWLWPYRETIRKVARSWSTTLSLFDQGHNFHFAGSQVAQFQWLKDHYPVLYDELNSAVKRGQFIPVGGTWVEMDTNIPSGESMIRQFLYGQKFYEREFGIQSNILWLPDTFGYSGQLPQIMRICGVEYFLSQKLSWNLTNTFPHHTFYWKGIDQTKVLAHFPPADTYESHIDVKDLIKSVTNNKDKGRTHDQMLLFGYGDGGGGPTPDMLHKLDRLSSVKGLPNVVRSTPNMFFERVEKDKLCEWWGELYFELHRGTYTTHAKLKENNRKCEFMMFEIEFLNAHSIKKKNCLDMQENFEKMWKIVLFNQFHDILPGSSIEQVFKDAMTDYAEFYKLWDVVYSEMIGEDKHHIPSTKQQKPHRHVVNPYNWARYDTMKIDDKYEIVEVQAMSIGDVKVVSPSVDDKVSVFELKNGVCICNKTLKVVFDHHGQLTSLIHKPSDRECIAEGCYGNQFVIFDDIPLFWDAWDVMEYHTETRAEVAPTRLEILEEGPVRVSLKITVPLKKHGHVSVTVSLDATSPFLAFRAEVDWKASHKFLKVEFPVSVSATDAEYEIQCGMLKRPTHANTSWDMAKFEVSGHKWAHLGEPNFGIGLLSKSKYGYSAQPNKLTMSLLRSSKSPDGNADIGRHVIEYALYPHAGPLYSSNIVKYAYNFSHPLTLRPGIPSSTQLFTLDAVSSDIPDQVILQTVKKSEDGLGVIVRMYEPYGNTVSVILSGSNITAAYSINAVERDNTKKKLEVMKTGTPELPVIAVGPLSFSPFQIKTVYLVLSGQPGVARRPSDSAPVSPTKRHKIR